MLISKIYPSGSTCRSRNDAKIIEATGTATELLNAFLFYEYLLWKAKRITIYRQVGQRELTGTFFCDRLRLEYETDLSGLGSEARDRAIEKGKNALSVTYRFATNFRVRIELQ